MSGHVSRISESHQRPVRDDPAVNGQFGDGWTVTVPPGMPLQPAVVEPGEGAFDPMPMVQFAPVVEVQLSPGASREVELPVGGPSVLLGTVRWIGTNSHLETRLLLNGSNLTTGTSYTFAGTRGGSDVRSRITAGGTATLAVTNTSAATVKIKMILGALDALHEPG
jgi:hypothetical protein